MTVKILMESIIIPKPDQDLSLELESGARALDAVEMLQKEGRTGTLTAEEVLKTHMLIRNSQHIKPQEELHDGDTLMIIKTLLGG